MVGVFSSRFCMLFSTSSSSSAKETKHISQGYSSSKLTSRHESRKHAVTDGRVTKKHGGLGYTSSNKSMEKGAKESRLLTPSYIYEDATPVPTTDQISKPQGPVDRPKDKPKSAVTPTERYNELSPLMTKMVEDELKNIMINVWQTLPESAPNDSEKLLVDKLKGSAGDDIRNTMGLNITKRLLNVHNAILIKVVIYSAVAPSEIQAFAKKYHITDFKHVQRWTYAGRMASWTQLDDLYATKNLKCGSSSVSVSPVYSFMKCPSNLRTIFDGKQNYSIAKKMEQEAARKKKKSEGKVIVTADKVLAEVAKKVIAKKNKDSDIKEVKDITEKSKTESTSKGKTEATKNIVVAKNAVDKPVGKKSCDNKQSAPTDIVKNKIKTPNENEIKTATKVASVKTAIATNINKKEVKPEIQANKVESGKTVAKKPPVTTNTPKEYAAAPQIYATKVETVKTVAQKPVATISPKKNIAPAKTNASGANEPIAINKNIASPKPNAIKVEATKAAVNKPSVSTNTPNKNIALPKQNTTKSEATITPKKEIVSAKPNEKKPVVTAKVELDKAPAKPVTNKPVTSNSAKKEALPQNTSETKKPEVKAAIIEPTKIKLQPKTVPNKPVTINTPKKETVKPKPTEHKKPDTKIVKVLAKAPVKPKINSKTNAKGKAKAENDFDELDDHDILALLSGGIVLDECSGSDED